MICTVRQTQSIGSARFEVLTSNGVVAVGEQTNNVLAGGPITLSNASGVLYTMKMYNTGNILGTLWNIASDTYTIYDGQGTRVGDLDLDKRDTRYADNIIKGARAHFNDKTYDIYIYSAGSSGRFFSICAEGDDAGERQVALIEKGTVTVLGKDEYMIHAIPGDVETLSILTALFLDTTIFSRRTISGLKDMFLDVRKMSKRGHFDRDFKTKYQF